MSEAFPGSGAQVHRNEAGEVTGWDYPADPMTFWCDICGVCHTGPCDGGWSDDEEG